MSGQMKDALRAYTIAAGFWLLWDLSLFAYGDKPYPWSLWWYEWQREFEFYPFSVIAVLLLVVLGWLRLRQNLREKEGLEATSPSEIQSSYSRASTKTRWIGAFELGGAGSMLGLVVYILCMLIGMLVSLIVPEEVFERMWPDGFITMIKDFVGIPMSVFAGVGFVTARDRDPSSIKPSDLLRGDSHWD